MKVTLKSAIVPFVITVFFLVAFEILMSTFFPFIGIQNYRLPFSSLVVIYFALRIEGPYNPIFILIVHYFHSLFTAEGWEVGTFIGTVISILIAYFKDLVRLQNWVLTVLIVQFLQTLWFGFEGILIYLKTDSLELFFSKVHLFIPESVCMSLLAPSIFFFLDKIWRSKESSIMGER